MQAVIWPYYTSSHAGRCEAGRQKSAGARTA